MSRPPSPPLTYGPAYLGLYACLLLAVLCNSFLDIRYGSFGIEAIFWGLTFALTLGIGWRQGGIASDSARSWQKSVLVLMGVLFLLVFMPMWGMPRAGVYLLCGLQAAQNCITTTRRHFQFGLLVSAVLVLFASSHLRADWTLLFYVLPYVLAVVLTLVAEQVARRSREVQQRSLGGGGAAGQGLAVVSAAAVILALAALFYGLTPQETWLSLSWRHGLPGGAIVGQGEAPGGGGSGGAQGAGGAGGQGGGAAAAGPARSDWPSVAEMREAARRPGMPGWQAAAINALADAGEGLERILAPLRQSLQELWQALQQWLQEHRQAVVATLLALLLLALLLAAWLLMRESRPLAWLRTRADYLHLGLWGRHGPGRQGARRLYAAAERLFDYHGEGRPAALTAREYDRRLRARFPDLAGDLHYLTGYFEMARYASPEPREKALAAMRHSYRRIFRELAD